MRRPGSCSRRRRGPGSTSPRPRRRPALTSARSPAARQARGGPGGVTQRARRRGGGGRAGRRLLRRFLEDVGGPQVEPGPPGGRERRRRGRSGPGRGRSGRRRRRSPPPGGRPGPRPAPRPRRPRTTLATAASGASSRFRPRTDGHREQLAGSGRRPGDPGDDDLPDPLGDGQRPPAPGPTRDVAEDLPDEERVALRPLVERRPALGPSWPGAGSSSSVSSSTVKPGEDEALDARDAAQVGQDGAERVVGPDLGVAEGGDDEEPGRAGGAQHVGEEAARSVGAPSGGRRPRSRSPVASSGGGQPGGHRLEQAVLLGLGVAAQRRVQARDEVAEVGQEADELARVAARGGSGGRGGVCSQKKVRASTKGS